MTDPIDDTQPHTNLDPADAPAPPATPDPAPEPASDALRATSQGAAPESERFKAEPPLRADPDRPADSGWREPAWMPPRERERKPSLAAVVVGLVLIGVGLWFFLDRTLGVALPRVQWSTIWPVILIVIGGLIVLRSFQRRA